MKLTLSHDSLTSSPILSEALTIEFIIGWFKWLVDFTLDFPDRWTQVKFTIELIGIFPCLYLSHHRSQVGCIRLSFIGMKTIN